MKNTNIMCDACNAILYGQDRAAFVKKPNLQINGQVVIQRVDNDSGYNYPIFVTKTPNDRMHFCDLVCFQDFCDAKEKRYEEVRVKGLRDRASGEYAERLHTRP